MAKRTQFELSGKKICEERGPKAAGRTVTIELHWAEQCWPLRGCNIRMQQQERSEHLRHVGAGNCLSDKGCAPVSAQSGKGLAVYGGASDRRERRRGQCHSRCSRERSCGCPSHGGATVPTRATAYVPRSYSASASRWRAASQRSPRVASHRPASTPPTRLCTKFARQARFETRLSVYSTSLDQSGRSTALCPVH